jgi:hypothetical protein
MREVDEQCARVVGHQQCFGRADRDLDWTWATAVPARRADRADEPEERLVVGRDQVELAGALRERLERGALGDGRAGLVDAVAEPAFDGRVVLADGVGPLALAVARIAAGLLIERRAPTAGTQRLPRR